MTEVCRRILDARSESERELLCQAAYGKPFAECVGQLQREDFMDGVDGGRYLILQMSNTAAADEDEPRTEVRFTCGNRDWRMLMLYESEPAMVGPGVGNAWVVQEPYRFRITLGGGDKAWLMTKMKEQMGIY